MSPSVPSYGGGKVGGEEYGTKVCHEEALKLDPKYVGAWVNLGVEGGGQVGSKEYGKKACMDLG